jgi:hypothetical protein
MLLMQSAPTAHAKPLAHALQPPPQSTSVSEPFLILSSQVPARRAHTPLEHLLLLQSLSSRQRRSLSHALRQLPPQSTSLSLPLRWPSSQLAATHSAFTQISLLQSEVLAQRLPFEQAGHVPPQSMSVSEPFFALSLQLTAGSAHTPL